VEKVIGYNLEAIIYMVVKVNTFFLKSPLLKVKPLIYAAVKAEAVRVLCGILPRSFSRMRG
jgi:hypothetical protein